MQVRQEQSNLGMDDQNIGEKKGNVQSLLFLLIRMASVAKNGASRLSSVYPQSVREFFQPLDKWLIIPRNKASSRFWIAVILVGAITFILRAVNLGRSFEVFIDEFTYLVISQSVVRNLQVVLYGHPFYLHPPAYFFIEAAFLKVFQPGGDTIHTILCHAVYKCCYLEYLRRAAVSDCSARQGLVIWHRCGCIVRA
jgi:hypothetical protein